ncbi:alpha/beta fold hydrolase [Jatrophihabitans lederbergiae]|uniref:alpha/beta fold hydrolase n=1 Tax=Jatrophihabitans lederbergiae TaxID=3075547 RepID=UPI0037BF6CB4
MAAVYTALLEELDLHEVTVIGNSIGGWIAAEIALTGSPRLGSAVLLDAAGLDVPDHPIADFFSLSMAQIAELSYHDPDAFRIDPTTFSPDQQAVMAANGAALALYAGTTMTDPHLRARLAAISVRPWCCGATPTASSMSRSGAPTPPPYQARGSSSCRPPGTCPNWKLPSRCSPPSPPSRPPSPQPSPACRRLPGLRNREQRKPP